MSLWVRLQPDASSGISVTVPLPANHESRFALHRSPIALRVSFVALALVLASLFAVLFSPKQKVAPPAVASEPSP